MAQMAYTAANIRPLPGAIRRHFDAGATVTVGQLVYVAADGDVEPADGNVSQLAATTVGVVVGVGDEYGGTSAAAGDGVTVVTHGPVGGFSSLAEGAFGYVSDTVGQLADAAGTYSYVVGVAQAVDIFYVQPGMSLPTSS